MTKYSLYTQYSTVVGRSGPASDEAHQLRREHVDDREFVEYANAIDALKRAVGGRGMEPQPAGR